MADYETPNLEALDAYETPQLLDVEEVVTATSGCYTLGIGGCSDPPAKTTTD